MKRIVRCTGVPEHFNLPWHMAIAGGAFQEEGLTVLWNDEPKGTGAMCNALEDGSTDVAIMVTTGTIRACLRNPAIKIIGTYVESPLQWGVHVPAGCSIQAPADVQQPKFAMSRYNSGSHLMAYLYAHQQGWPLQNEDLEVIHDLHGARKHFLGNPNSMFLWERFTTDFLVALGEFRRIDIFTPPWPCFLIAARTEVIESNEQALQRMLSVVQRTATAFRTEEKGYESVAEQYELTVEQAAQWWDTVQWSPTTAVNSSSLFDAAKAMHDLGILEGPLPAEQALFDRIVKLPGG